MTNQRYRINQAASLRLICALLAVRFTVEKRKGAFVRYTAVNTLPKTEEDADYER